jgi:hypothetical protein
MWLYLAGLSLGFLGVMDLIVNIVAVRVLGFNLVELGILNAAWTIAVIPSLRHANALSNAGLTRRPVILGFTSLVVFIVLLYDTVVARNITLVYPAYMLHAVAYSYIKTGCQTAVLEAYRSSSWSYYSRRLSQFAVLSQGVGLLAVSRVWSGLFQAWNYLALSLAILLVNASLMMLIPQPSLRFERILTRIEQYLKKGLTRIHGYLTVSSLDYADGDKLNMIVGRFLGEGVSIPVLALALVSFRVGNEYLFTPLPYVFIYYMGLRTPDVIALYGLGMILGFVIMLVMPSNVASKGALSLSVLAKIAGVVSIVAWRPALMASSSLLALIYVSNIVIDTTLYTIYIQATSGSNVGLYSMVAEASSLFGTLTSGLVMVALGLNTTILVLVALNLAPLLLIGENW